MTYESGSDYLYLPRRLREIQVSLELSDSLQDEATLSYILQAEIGQAFELSTEECQLLFSAYVCNSLFFRSINISGNFSLLPSPLCPEECQHVENECPTLWNAYRKTALGKHASCDRTGMLLEPLPYCCHGGGISLPTPAHTSTVLVISSSHTSSMPTAAMPAARSSNTGVAVGVSVTLILLLLFSALVAVGLYLIIRKFRRLKKSLSG